MGFKKFLNKLVSVFRPDRPQLVAPTRPSVKLVDTSVLPVLPASRPAFCLNLPVIKAEPIPFVPARALPTLIKTVAPVGSPSVAIPTITSSPCQSIVDDAPSVTADFVPLVPVSPSPSPRDLIIMEEVDKMLAATVSKRLIVRPSVRSMAIWMTTKRALGMPVQSNYCEGYLGARSGRPTTNTTIKAPPTIAVPPPQATSKSPSGQSSGSSPSTTANKLGSTEEMMRKHGLGYELGNLIHLQQLREQRQQRRVTAARS